MYANHYPIPNSASTPSSHMSPYTGMCSNMSRTQGTIFQRVVTHIHKYKGV